MAAERIAVAALRRQRQIEHPVADGKHTLVLEIPTDRQFFRIVEANPDMSDGLLNCELVKACLVGWRDVKDSDLLSSGTDDAAVFDKDLAAEWIDDHAEWWGPAAAALLEARRQRKGQREADQGN